MAHAHTLNSVISGLNPNLLSMSREFDIIILGATGYTGQYESARRFASVLTLYYTYQVVSLPAIWRSTQNVQRSNTPLQEDLLKSSMPSQTSSSSTTQM